MKTKNKVLSVITSALVCCTAITSLHLKANAFYLFVNEHKLNADMSKCKCYYPNEIASRYGERIMRGATSWQIRYKDLDFTLNWSRTEDSLNRTAAVTTSLELEDNVLARTDFYYMVNRAMYETSPE